MSFFRTALRFEDTKVLPHAPTPAVADLVAQREKRNVLSIAKWIVDRDKGIIEVQSKIGKGSTFTVNIPLND